MAEINLRDRVTRAEERLIAEQSVRKTRDDQLFRFISQAHSDLEKQHSTMQSLNSTLQALNTTMIKMDGQVGNLTESIKSLQKENQSNRDRIQEINGSVRAIKWVWPVIMTLAGVILTLFVANVDLRLEQEIRTDGNVEVVVDEEPDE